MKIKKLLENNNLSFDLPDIILDYEALDFDDYHKEEDEDGSELIVFTKENDEGHLLEGILSPSKKTYFEFTKPKDSDIRYPNGGVSEEGYNI